MINKIKLHIKILLNIGLYNYVFFFIYLKGDDFSNRLSLIECISLNKDGTWYGFDRLNKFRKLAHDIDIKIKDIIKKHEN